MYAQVLHASSQSYKDDMATSIRLIVRFDSNHGIPVDVTPSTSVEDLKKLIAGQRGLAANDVRVIFCGRELQNHMTIKVVIMRPHWPSY